MYEITIKLDEVISTFTIEELKELKAILECFREIDEFHLENKGNLKGNTEPKKSK